MPRPETDREGAAEDNMVFSQAHPDGRRDHNRTGLLNDLRRSSTCLGAEHVVGPGSEMRTMLFRRGDGQGTIADRLARSTRSDAFIRFQNSSATQISFGKPVRILSDCNQEHTTLFCRSRQALSLRLIGDLPSGLGTGTICEHFDKLVQGRWVVPVFGGSFAARGALTGTSRVCRSRNLLGPTADGEKSAPSTRVLAVLEPKQSFFLQHQVLHETNWIGWYRRAHRRSQFALRDGGSQSGSVPASHSEPTATARTDLRRGSHHLRGASPEAGMPAAALIAQLAVKRRPACTP